MAVIFALLLASGSLFEDKRKLQSFKFDEYGDIGESPDIAIFGSSHAYSTYDSKMLEHELGVKVFNFGAPVQNLQLTKLFAQEVLEQGNLKLGIIDLFHTGLEIPPFTDRVASFQYESLDYLNLTTDKIRLHNYFYGKKRVLNIFPAIRDHVLWDERFLQPDYTLSRDVEYNKGFKTDLYFDRDAWKRLSKGRAQTDSPGIDQEIQLSPEQKRMIDELITVFENHKVPLLFTSSPIHRKYMDSTYFTYQYRIRTYLEKAGVEFIDYNRLWDELEIHLYDFKDLTHVNSSGALKVSKHLTAYIQKAYPEFQSKSTPPLPPDPTNRFYQMDSGFKDALAYVKVSDSLLRRKTGVEELALFKDGYGRLEILLMGKELREINLRATYEMLPQEARNLPKTISNRITENKYLQKTYLRDLKSEGQYGGSQYKTTEFKVVKVDCPFSNIRNLKIFIGQKRPETMVLRIKKTEL